MQNLLTADPRPMSWGTLLLGGLVLSASLFVVNTFSSGTEFAVTFESTDNIEQEPSTRLQEAKHISAYMNCCLAPGMPY